MTALAAIIIVIVAALLLKWDGLWKVTK